MTSNELRLAAKLLRMASDEFGNHGCNDFDLSTVGFTEDDAKDMLRQFHDVNGDPDSFVEDERNGRRFSQTYDWMMMDLMARKLDEEAKKL